MKKLIPFLTFAFIIILFLSIYYVKIHNSNHFTETTLSKSFEFTEAKIVSSEIYFWGRLDGYNNNSGKVKTITNDILNSLNIIEDSSLSKKTFENVEFEKTEIKGLTGDKRVVEVVVQFDRSSENSKDRYISVKVTEDLSTEMLDETKKVIKGVFDKYRINIKVNSCITGFYEGKLDYDHLEDISRRVFKEVEASKVEGIRDGNFISVSAYSPNIDDFIKVNGKKINLNLAVRYNSYENRTYIWLATPVITTEY